MSESSQLPNSDKRALVIKAGMELIPYVGGSLATLYFGTKQEKRFKRLESFYKELSSDIARMRDNIAPIDKHDAGALEAIIELLHERIEAEPTLEKREFFKNYFKNTLKCPVVGNFDERNYFLRALSEMTLLECDLLAFINSQSSPLQVGSIEKPADKYAIVGAVGRLKSRGFLTAIPSSIVVDGATDNSLLEVISVSSFGKSFISFCLQA
ncbi:MAG TPA: hypothetical protein VMW36_07930 [Patescibacteria group bacterium]|nr:hypothetical protein [Patescibacteria group bacterium]